jgi:hypothetical protein
MVMLYKTITKKSAPSNWQESFISKYATSHPGRLGRNMGTLSSYHGYGRNRVFFWFECKTYWKTKEMKTKSIF